MHCDPNLCFVFYSSIYLVSLRAKETSVSSLGVKPFGHRWPLKLTNETHFPVCFQVWSNSLLEATELSTPLKHPMG